MTKADGALKRGWTETDQGIYERKVDRSEWDNAVWNERPTELIKLAVKNVRMPQGGS